MSLSIRLSWWLALQSFAAMAAVCLIVYHMTSKNIEARQYESLIQKQLVLRHLLTEFGSQLNSTALSHRIDDVLLAHDDLSLQLFRPNGEKVYISSPLQDVSTKPRQFQFFIDHPALPEGRVNGIMMLSTASDQKVLNSLATTLVASSIFGSLLVSIGGVLLIRSGMLPVRHLVEQTRQLAADSLSRRLNGDGQPQELQPLIFQFNALLGRLDAAYEQLEGFNADVAHELYTPLANLISGSELAVRGGLAKSELFDLVTSNLEELHRLEGIVTDMLFLSRADRGALARREPVGSLAGVICTVVDLHEAALEERGLRVGVIGDASGEFDTALIRRAISNLVSNAGRFATHGSTVYIRIRQEESKKIRIAVSNAGNTIAQEHLPKLFDRFYRVDASRQRSDRNHGLGLSIVAAISRMHGGRPFATSISQTTTIGFTLEGPNTAR